MHSGTQVVEAQGQTTASSIAAAPVGDVQQSASAQLGATSGAASLQIGSPASKKGRARQGSIEGISDREPLDDTSLSKTLQGQAPHAGLAGQSPASSSSGGASRPYPDARSAGDQNSPGSISATKQGMQAGSTEDEHWLHAAARAHGAAASAAYQLDDSNRSRSASNGPPSSKGAPQNGKYGPASPHQNGKVRNGMRSAASAGSQQLLELAAIANGLANGLHADDHSSSASSDTGLQSLIVEQAKAAHATSAQSGQRPGAADEHHHRDAGAGDAAGDDTAGTSKANGPSQPSQGPSGQAGDDEQGERSAGRGGELDVSSSGGAGAWSEPASGAGTPQASSRDSREGREGGHSGGSHRNSGSFNRTGGNWNNGGNGSYGVQGGLQRHKGSRGSFNSLQNAGNASGGRGYRNNNNNNAYRGQYGGGNSNRASMDDTLLGQVGPIPQRPASRGPSLQVGRDVGVQASMDSACTTPTSVEPAGMSDLDRFILQVTPIINLNGSGKPAEAALQSLCLEDVWRFYMEPSLYGREVYTLGGARGPSLCYFVPYLSAMQLFTPASSKDRGTNRLHVCDTEGWPKHMHLRFEHFETELPFNRHPMYEQIELLSQQQAAQAAAQQAAAAAATAANAPAQPVAAVTSSSDAAGQSQPTDAAGGVQASGDAEAAPATAAGSTKAPSALAVEGEPAGASHAASSRGSTPTGSRRQSEAGSTVGTAAAGPSTDQPGLNGTGMLLRDTHIKDLHPASWYAVAWYPVYRIPDAPLVTRFLTFHSFSQIVTSIQNSMDMLQEGREPVLGSWPVPVHGLKWYNMHGERWLEPLTDGQAAGSRDEQQQGGGNGGGSSYGGRGGGPNNRNNRQFSQAQYVQARNIDIHYHAVLGELQATAERFARGRGLRLLGQMGAEELRVRHPDFEFFHTRG